MSNFSLQLRVDFNNFVIAGPNTVATTIGVLQFGQPVPVGTTAETITQQTQCSTDQFVMTGPAGSVPPVICGTNNNQHGKLSKPRLERLLANDTVRMNAIRFFKLLILEDRVKFEHVSRHQPKNLSQ